MVITAPFVISLKASNQSMVRGCPGVPNTCPRLEGVIEIRSRDSAPFTVRAVTIDLNTTQFVSVPSSGFGSNDVVRTYNLHRNNTAYTPPAGLLYEEALGLDIPFIIPLPKDITSSGKFPRWNATTTHSLMITASWGPKSETCSTEFPVAIKKFDTLPVFRQFNEPITQTIQSTDKMTTIEYSIPNNAIGPHEELIMYVKIIANNRKALSDLRSKFSSTDKIRLRAIKFSLNEILECHEGGLPASKTLRIASVTKDLGEQAIDSNGVLHELSIQFPVENEILKTQLMPPGSPSKGSPEKGNPLLNRVITNTTLVEDTSTDIGVPITHSQGFTSTGRLFTVRYEVVLKLKFAHAKDQEVTLPITVSPYDRIVSTHLLKWIFKEWESRIKQFGNMDGLSESELIRQFAVKPPILYRPRNTHDWVRLGLSEKYMGKKGKGGGIVHYIN
ncbi:hypothetical protein BABINDRAFT_167015 [Babjeviella inositovora NRRL Y-12698]|uniref:Arrestin C-terminal-like domain-containing protein n=1 Tax=Babjeviella inositovora NRRL Y-12698 TaxID=984486 RepID=A0A1E3QQF1_9ASCO|nr:uncharacterized protein BABINDRAFT_167015 [Babjeviella inositovora NRRL Y-12698]ODQ79911.1 hypothetical protein BABINDRAFT_167015 [Babjeviella inositovora NRRL Y-12698]